MSDLDLLHGAKAIAEELGLTERQVRHLLESGKLSSAFKLNWKWTIRRTRLRADIEGLENARQPPAAA